MEENNYCTIGYELKCRPSTELRIKFCKYGGTRLLTILLKTYDIPFCRPISPNPFLDIAYEVSLVPPVTFLAASIWTAYNLFTRPMLLLSQTTSLYSIIGRIYDMYIF